MTPRDLERSDEVLKALRAELVKATAARVRANARRSQAVAESFRADQRHAALLARLQTLQARRERIISRLACGSVFRKRRRRKATDAPLPDMPPPVPGFYANLQPRAGR